MAIEAVVDTWSTADEIAGADGDLIITLSSPDKVLSPAAQQ